ncbi:hypothetical protein M422DRAFT_23902 [Sphaerobolus stellatus SS14]|nr:hypothetical protein M422DRAFT_23902 [Sphaerobolus stellatus SS14]
MQTQQGHDDIENILNKLTDSRPFIHQLDVILTSSLEQARSLSSLATTYYRSKLTFAALFGAYSLSSGFTALSVGNLSTEEVWCLDTRGILSVSLNNETYEQLGITAGAQTRTRSLSLARKIRHLIQIDLKDNSTLAVRAKENLKKWDTRRAAAGEDGWQVLLSFDFPSPDSVPGKKHAIATRLCSTQDVNVPSHILPKSDNAQDAVAPLFEWLGLACIGSQRILVNDKINQYVANYDPPANSSSGTIHHLQWAGLISPPFIRSVLEQVLSKNTGLRGVSAVSFDSPVSYIASTGSTMEGENVWSLIASDAVEDSSHNSIHWILVENK